MPIIVGGQGAEEVAQELKSTGARVVVSVNYPTRPKELAPDADEPLEVLQARAQARRAAGALAAAGVPFGFGSVGLKDPKEFVANVRVASERGLPRDAAIRALTLDGADAGWRRRPTWIRSSAASAPTSAVPKATCSTPNRRSNMSSSAGA